MGLFGKKKSVKISGEYFGTHPAIKGHHKRLYLIAHEGGIDVHSGGVWKMDKEKLTTLPWGDVTGFSYDENTQQTTGSRVSASRVAAVGVLALAAKKKTVATKHSMVSTLSTKTGDIEIEFELDSDSGTTTGQNGDQLTVIMSKRSNKNFRAFVADHVTAA